MWTLTDKGRAFDPIPEVPMRDMSDDEFREASRLYNERMGFSEQGRYLHHSGFWEHSEGEHVEETTDGAE